MQEQMQPQNFEAEQTVLGMILWLPDTFEQVQDRLKASDFYYGSYRHSDIYQAMQEVYKRQETISTESILTHLRHKGVETIHEQPVLRYLQELWNIGMFSDGIGTAANHILNASMKRRINATIAAMARMVHDEEDAATMLENAEAMLYELSQGTVSDDLTPLSQVMTEFVNELDRRNSEFGKVVGVSTGFKDLDYLIGGLQPQELIILGGRPGEGKTSLLLNIVYNVLFQTQKQVAFFSLEMSRLDLARRLVSMQSGIDGRDLRSRALDERDFDAVIQATDTLSEISQSTGIDRLFVDQSGHLNLTSLRSKCRRHKAKYGLDLVVVDYLQLMNGKEDTDKQKMERRQEIDKISRGLKQLSKDLNVPVLACASLSRASETRADPKPKLSDLRESGSIESDADIVMFIRRSKEQDCVSLVNVEKHRNGPIGDVALVFNPALTRFADMDVNV